MITAEYREMKRCGTQRFVAGFLLLYPTVWDRLAILMKAVFVETTDFTDWVHRFLPDDVYSQLQQELMNDPEKGAVIRGCGGLRKVRTADPRRGKGKRGGARIIYLYVPEARWFYMLDIYGKDEKEDLTPDELAFLADLAVELKTEAIAAVRRRVSQGKKRTKS